MTQQTNALKRSIPAFLLGIVVTGAFLTPAALWAVAVAPIVNNGGFESAPDGANSSTGSTTYASSFTNGTTTINGWTFGTDGTVSGDARVEWYTSSNHENWNAVPPQAGNYAIELNSDSQNGRLYAQASFYQGRSLSIGSTYELSFYVAPENNWNQSNVTSVSGEVTIDGASSYVFQVAAPQGDATSDWTKETLTFVATSATPTIRIYDGTLVNGVNSNWSSTYGNDLNIDSVTLNLKLVATPEPETYAAGLLLLMTGGWAERKRLKHLLLRKASDS